MLEEREQVIYNASFLLHLQYSYKCNKIFLVFSEVVTCMFTTSASETPSLVIYLVEFRVFICRIYLS